MSFRATVLTLFPEMFPGPLGICLAGNALAPASGRSTRDIRDHGIGRHRNVDDTPAGGGPGMVLRADVLAAAIDAADTLAGPAAPADEPARQAIDAGAGAGTRGRSRALIVCGRFEGVDERVIEARGLEEVSIGDYVLSGGEIAAMVLLDACVRLLPGVMGKEASGTDESFSRRASSNIPTTRARGNWRAGRSRRCCSPATTPRWPAGGARRRKRMTRERRPDLWAARKKRNPPKSKTKGDNAPALPYRAQIRAASIQAKWNPVRLQNV